MENGLSPQQRAELDHLKEVVASRAGQRVEDVELAHLMAQAEAPYRALARMAMEDGTVRYSLHQLWLGELAARRTAQEHRTD